MDLFGAMDDRLTAEWLVERMTSLEHARAQRVERVLPVLAAAAEAADAAGAFPHSHVQVLSEAGLLGLMVPEEYGGLGGTLRDLAGATYALGTACPSTALAFYFHCSSAARGMLALEGLKAGMFTAAETVSVAHFAERLLTKMGSEGRWVANFASEPHMLANDPVAIQTVATPDAGGWRLNGEKPFGSATGVADEYLVTARMAGVDGPEGLALFLTPREREGVQAQSAWDPIGMRATATNGIRLENVFVPEQDALVVPGAIKRMMEVNRGTFVGHAMAGYGVYLGAAQRVYDFALEYLGANRFEDTGEPLGLSPLHQVLVGQMAVKLETAYLWLRRQLELETTEPPLLDQPDVARQWQMCKGVVTENAFDVAVLALKACGTSNTGMHGPISRAVRDLAMGLVQGFPAERGYLRVARLLFSGDTSVNGENW